MFEYRNTKTGVTVFTPCPVNGDWELIRWIKCEGDAQEAEVPAVKPKKTTAKKRTAKK